MAFSSWRNDNVGVDKACGDGYSGSTIRPLQSFGKAAAFLCRPEQCHNGKTERCVRYPVKEARTEWRRRQKRVGLERRGLLPL